MFPFLRKREELVLGAACCPLYQRLQIRVATRQLSEKPLLSIKLWWRTKLNHPPVLQNEHIIQIHNGN